mmetsp:Transcript_15002/g.23617  ORF Transcript_15002/g.23617 Transcript_15002/m.23617 type:complete len:161 (-) Transcript_15002:210-692(-)
MTNTHSITHQQKAIMSHSISTSYLTASDYTNRARLLSSIAAQKKEDDANHVIQVEGLELLMQMEAEIEEAMLNGMYLNDSSIEDDDDSYANDSFEKNARRLPRTKCRRHRQPTASRRNSSAATVLLKEQDLPSATNKKPNDHPSLRIHDVVQRRFSNQAA